MKKILDVGLQRRISKKKQKKKYFKIFILFLFFFVAIVFAWRFSFGRFMFKDDGVNFPIFFSSDSVLNFEKTKTGFCILTNNQLNFYKSCGKKSRDFLTNNCKMEINSCEEYVLAYEKDAKNFSVQTSGKVLFSGILKNNIKFGKIFKNGIFAFVTDSESSFCELVVFNKKNEQIFKWNSAESLIIDFNFVESGKGLVIATFSVENGFVKSSIFEVRFDSSEEILKKDFEKYMPISIKKNGSVIVLVCDLKTFFIDSRGSVINEIEYKSDIEKFFLTSSGYFVLLLSDINNSKSILFSYDKFGSILSKLNLEEKVKKIKSSGKDIFILGDNFLIHTDITLKIIDKVTFKESVDDFIYITPYIYYISANKIDRLSIK